MALTQVQSGILADSTQTYGMKNRIINGDMRVWQRATSVTGSTGYNSVDRWDINGSTSTLNVAQSTDAPAGFTYSTGITVGTASSASGAYSYMVQQIEGYNWADLNYGTASAATSTLSFWVKSSVTGTYGLSFRNTSSARFYTTTYTINSANTWEQKTITITGDTSGTWLKTNGSGFSVFWDLGIGSTYSSASNNAWSTVGSNYFGVTSTTKLASTSGATFYITGIQLEKGSTATAFDYRSFGTELTLCQRYFEKTYDYATAIGTATENGWEWIGTDCGNVTTTGTLQSQRPRFSVTKRTQPTINVWDATGASAKATRYYVTSGPSNGHACTTDLITSNSFRVFVAGTTTTTNGAFHWAANAEL